MVSWTLFIIAWWRHQVKTFSALLAICAGNSPVPGEFPAQRPVTRSFDVFFDLQPNKWLSKQWRGWWFETPSCPLRRHLNGYSLWLVAWRLKPLPEPMLNTYLSESLHSSESNFIVGSQLSTLHNEFRNRTFKIINTSLSDQWAAPVAIVLPIF